jgi:hypothetical protein
LRIATATALLFFKNFPKIKPFHFAIEELKIGYLDFQLGVEELDSADLVAKKWSRYLHFIIISYLKFFKRSRLSASLIHKASVLLKKLYKALKTEKYPLLLLNSYSGQSSNFRTIYVG